MFGMIMMFIIIGAGGVGLTYVGCDTDCAVLKWIGYAIGTKLVMKLRFLDKIGDKYGKYG